MEGGDGGRTASDSCLMCDYARVINVRIIIIIIIIINRCNVS